MAEAQREQGPTPFPTEGRGASGPAEAHDIDPELVRLRRRVAGVGPLLLASVLTLAGYVMFSLRADLRFAFRGPTPRELGRLAGAADLPENDYVAVEALPDRSLPARLHGRQDTGQRLLPVLGTSGRVWLAVEGEASTAHPAHDERYVGRPRRLSDLGFAEALRGWLEKSPPQPRFLDLAALPGPGGAGAPEAVRDVAGDEVLVSPDAPVEIEQRVDGVAHVTVLRLDSIPDEAAARRALSAAGVAGAEAAPVVAQNDLSWTFELPAESDPAGTAGPAGLDALRQRLAHARLYAATVARKTVLVSSRWDAVSRDGDALRVGDQRLPAATVESLSVLAPRRLPPDAQVLLIGQKPGDFWYVGPLYGALGLLSLLMVWAFVRTLRRPAA